jgi:hypothetical protein
MSIETITIEDLRGMEGKEGLILQGCGGPAQEWLDGINDLFQNEGLLKAGSKFTDCAVFDNAGVTCILYPFEGVQLELGKLAMWRLQTHDQFLGTWLSDYMENKLGGFISKETESQQKPDCPLIGQDGNTYNLMGIASRTLKQNGMREQAKEMCERITSSKSYYEALNILGEYVNITSVADEDEDDAEDWEEPESEDEDLDEASEGPEIQ